MVYFLEKNAIERKNDLKEALPLHLHQPIIGGIFGSLQSNFGMANGTLMLVSPIR